MRLLEAATRGLWNAGDDRMEALKGVAPDIEGDREDVMGEVTEEFQGGKIDVLTTESVEKWKMEWRMAGN